MASTSNIRTTIRDTIASFLAAYVAAIEQPDNASVLLSRDLAPSCKRFIRPASVMKSLGIDTSNAEDNETYAARMQGEIPLLETVHVNAIEESLVIDVEARKAAFRSEHWLTLKGRAETMLEFSWFMDFDKDGGKIEKIVQVLDTAECAKYVDAMMDVAKDLGGHA
ncbi:hypothetical protein FB45DRAFT_900545 [Roridomyces roridus]|uniref:Uncharacterized protein n=1 Tax=Roridomyces roridus TaxID=1738132 RepID=A0AAD7C7S6_9AGAR|nr:hypothetical protein FB45DRAFT_900545 [Roridomyces roridus]